MSTNATPLPSVRSLASDLALARGVDLDGIVTLGNWSSFLVFDQHYRDQRIQSRDITSVVLRDETLIFRCTRKL